MNLRRLVPAGLAVLLLLTGCGSESEVEDLNIGGAKTPSATPTEKTSDLPLPAGVPSPKAPPSKSEKVSEKRAGAYALQLPEKAEQAKVAEAVVAYLDARMRAYNTGMFHTGEFAQLSSGEALTGVQSRVLELREDETHVVGHMWLQFHQVQLKGQAATVTGCALNSTVDVSKAGVALESPSPAYEFTAQAKRPAPDLWLISKVQFRPANGC